MDKRKQILQQCEEAKQTADTIKNDFTKHEIVRKIAELRGNRVDEIINLCSVEKYNVYFNGKVGIGKSTAISHLFELIDEELINNYTKDKRAKLNDITLLKVASGRTTVCETEIKQITEGKSKIIVEKLPFDEFTLIVKEYCESILSKEKDDCIKEKDECVKEKIDKSTEIQRVLGNMSKFPLDSDDEEKVNYIKDNLDDYTGGKINQDILFKAVIKVIDYENRNKCNYVFEEGNFDKWFKDTISDINDGKIEECPFPYRIIIEVNHEDKNMNLPSFIDRIIDTRGIDGGVREDIRNTMMMENSISIMCDEVDGICSNETIIKTLAQTLISADKDSKYRTLLVGLERESSLENANDATSREQGKKIKHKEAIQKLNEKNINFKKENIAFYDPLFGIEYNNKRLILDINKKLYDKEKKSFLEFVDNCLKNMYSIYYDEILSILKDLNILEGNTIQEDTIQKFKKCEKIILDSKNKAETSNFNIVNKFKGSLSSNYASVIRASVNRNGVYYNLNVYDESASIGGNEFQYRCEKEKDYLLRRIKDEFDINSQIEEICFSSIEDKINYEYRMYFEKNRNEFRNVVEAKLLNSTVWAKVQQYWGDKLGGYIRRVVDDLTDEIIKTQIVIQLQQCTNYISFFDNIQTFIQFNNQEA